MSFLPQGRERAALSASTSIAPSALSWTLPRLGVLLLLGVVGELSPGRGPGSEVPASFEDSFLSSSASHQD